MKRINGLGRHGVIALAMAGALVSAASVCGGADAGGRAAPAYSQCGRYETPHPKARRIGYLSWNLGATGARGWAYGFGGHTNDSREIVIKSIEKGSPADGVLRRYDVITGANGKAFTSDARKAIGWALTEAEKSANKGQLRLTRWRDGQTTEVTIQLPLTGEYSPTSPFDCRKSEKILAGAAAYLAEHMPVEGFGSGGDGAVGGVLNALALLGTGEVRYLDAVRRTAYRMGPPDLELDDVPNMKSWPYGYINLLLAEYYLATGDAHVLKAMKLFSKRLCDGQGMPGAWGHGMANNRTLIGYGALNQAGLVCFMSLGLATECGLRVDKAVLARSTMFFGKYAGVGGIPYGDHPPAVNGNAANGKNALAAVAFDLLDRKPIADWFSHMVCSSDEERELGHTGNFFSFVWGGPGAVRAGREAFAIFMRKQQWYYDMFRRWDGSLLAQPWPQTREGDLGMTCYVTNGPLWCTGGYALTYALPRKQIRILGAPKSVFGRTPKALAGAMKLYKGKQYARCREALKPALASTDGNVAAAKQLDRAARRQLESIRLTLADIDAQLAAGDLYQVRCRVAGIEPILPAGDKRLAAAKAALAKAGSAKRLEIGKRYHALARKVVRAEPRAFMRFGPAIVIDPKSRKAMQAIADDPHAGVYAKLAAKQLADLPGEQPESWITLVVSEHRAEERRRAIEANVPWQRPNRADMTAAEKTVCRYHPLGKPLATAPKGTPAGGAAPTGWHKVGFDDAAWASSAGPVGSVEVCKGKLHTREGLFRVTFNAADPTKYRRLRVDCLILKTGEVYLNGEKILSVGEGNAKTPTQFRSYELKDTATQLLRKGPNVLAVKVTGAKDCGFDIAIDALPK